MNDIIFRRQFLPLKGKRSYVPSWSNQGLRRFQSTKFPECWNQFLNLSNTAKLLEAFPPLNFHFLLYCLYSHTVTETPAGQSWRPDFLLCTKTLVPPSNIEIQCLLSFISGTSGRSNQLVLNLRVMTPWFKRPFKEVA